MYNANLCKCLSNAFTEFIGFSAYAINTQEPASGDVIELRGVVTNAGGAYNPINSTFTCPTTAYYYIYFSLNLAVTGYYYDCHIDITMDDSMIVEVRHRDKCCDDKHFGRARQDRFGLYISCVKHSSMLYFKF